MLADRLPTVQLMSEKNPPQAAPPKTLTGGGDRQYGDKGVNVRPTSRVSPAEMPAAPAVPPKPANSGSGAKE